MNLIRQARLRAGLTQVELSARSGASRPTLSAYERDEKSPSLVTAARILAATGHNLTIEPVITFSEHDLRRGRSIVVPDRLPRLALEPAFASVRLPLHLNWSTPNRVFHMANRNDRARVYELVISQGRAEDLLAHLDGALLVDLWDELVLPQEVRSFWGQLMDDARGGS